MTKRVMILFVITVLVIAVLGVSASARTNGDGGSRSDRIQQYSFNPYLQLNDETRDLTPSTKSQPVTSLGTHSADGGSPGHIIGRSFRDDQAHLNPGRFVDWRGNPTVHFIFAGQLLPGHNVAAIGRWLEYTMFDPTTPPNGVFLTNTWVQVSPLTTGGWYPNLSVDETNHAIPVGEEFNPADPTRLSTIFWDQAGPGAWGTFTPDALPQALSIDPAEYIMYPRIEYQDYDGKMIVHVVALEDSGDEACDLDAITYWRKELDSARAAGTWTTMLVSDNVWSNHMDISAARGGSGNVGIAWIEWPGYCNGEDGGKAVIHVIESINGGLAWLAEVEITDEEWEYQPWVDIAGTYDTDHYLHLVYNSSLEGVIDPARVYHWTNRVVGPDGGGTTSLIAIADGYEHMCGRGSSNVNNTGKPMISQCDTLLYVTWTQYGRWQDGDSLDCAADQFANDNGAPIYNADIYMSVSSSLNGLLWDLQRNLTDSHTPDCDSTDANNCDHDTYGTMARYGMNMADFPGTYWNAASDAYAVRDVLDNSFPADGYYLDFQYINDLFPEPSRYNGTDSTQIWRYNPIKWFRLPCVQPIIEPRIYITQADYLHPVDWVKNGDIVTVDLVIENLGNAELEVTGIVEDVDQSWLTVLTSTPFTIPPASEEITQFQINASGFADGTTTALDAELVVSSSDVKAGDISYIIATIAADTVIQVVWDTIMTASIVEDTLRSDSGVALTVSTHGNAGNVGEGAVNMDFDGFGECLEGVDVYLYDLCPVVMHSASQYSWQPFWQDTRTDTVNFQPIIGDEEHSRTVTADYEVMTTGTFVSCDSLIACNKYFIAPTNNHSFILERWDIYSFDGVSTHSGVALGEWIDWDIPTDANEGGVVDSEFGTDYAFQQGIDADSIPCIAESRRFGASGLLGYFTDSEYEADETVNNNALFGGFVQLDDDIFEDGTDDTFLPDSAWAFLNRNSMSANNTEDEDQQIWLSYGTFDIDPEDVLHIWTVHATVYDGVEDDLQAVIDSATAWYLANREAFHVVGCCGMYSDMPTGIWPLKYTGNTNCSDDGKRTLSDITKLIDNVYISKDPLCCYASGNTNGSWDDGECKITLSDITKLIDAVYISKELTEACNKGCER